MDWDGDGRDDLIVQNGSNLGVYLSAGSSYSSLIRPPYRTLELHLRSDEWSAPGMDDLGCWGNSGADAVTYYAHYGIPDLAKEFADGFGNSASPTYMSLTQGAGNGNYVQYNNATYPNRHYIGPIYVVTNVVFSDPSTTTGTYNQEIWYYEAWVNLQGRGFDGFYAMLLRTAGTISSTTDGSSKHFRTLAWNGRITYTTTPTVSLRQKLLGAGPPQRYRPHPMRSAIFLTPAR